MPREFKENRLGPKKLSEGFIPNFKSRNFNNWIYLRNGEKIGEMIRIDWNKCEAIPMDGRPKKKFKAPFLCEKYLLEGERRSYD